MSKSKDRYENQEELEKLIKDGRNILEENKAIDEVDGVFNELKPALKGLFAIAFIVLMFFIVGDKIINIKE